MNCGGGSILILLASSRSILCKGYTNVFSLICGDVQLFIYRARCCSTQHLFIVLSR